MQPKTGSPDPCGSIDGGGIHREKWEGEQAMAPKGSDLAARFRVAVQREEVTRSEEEKQEAVREEAARRARAELFGSLVELGGELPFLVVEEVDGGVVFRRGDRELRFLPAAEGPGVVLTFSGSSERDQHRLYREPALGERWIWVRARRGKEDRLPLFDQGLEVLFVHALGLPQPEPVLSADLTEPPDDDGAQGGRSL